MIILNYGFGPESDVFTYVSAGVKADDTPANEYWLNPGITEFAASEVNVGTVEDPDWKTRLTPKSHTLRIVSYGKPSRSVSIPFVLVTTDNQPPPGQVIGRVIHWETVEPGEWALASAEGASILDVVLDQSSYPSPYYYVDRALPELTGTAERDEDDNDRPKITHAIYGLYPQAVLPGIDGLFGTMAHDGSGRITGNSVLNFLMRDHVYQGFLGTGWFARVEITRGDHTIIIDRVDGPIIYPPEFDMPLGINPSLPYPGEFGLTAPPAMVYRPPAGFVLVSQTDTTRVWESTTDPSDTYEVVLSRPLDVDLLLKTRMLTDLGIAPEDPTPAHFFDAITGRILVPPCDRVNAGAGSATRLRIHNADLGAAAEYRLVYSSADGVEFISAVADPGDGYIDADSMSEGRLLWGFGVVAPHRLAYNPSYNPYSLFGWWRGMVMLDSTS
jgi:hypothetical protein